MLYIVASYHFTQFQGKLTNQTWENSKNLVLGQLLVHFAKIRDQKKFIRRFYICQMLDIIACYQCMQFQGKLMKQTWENSKKPSFATEFGPFCPKFGPWKIFLKVLPLLDVIHFYKLSLYATSRKTNKPNLRKWFVLDFGPFGPNSGYYFLSFSNIWLCQSLDVVVNYHVRYQKS